jgi:predicted DNA-binding transcriptional regulator AlpA
MKKNSKKPARAPQQFRVAKKHHLDRRADAIAAVESDAADDQLLTSQEVAVWFGVSTQWLEIGRSKGYGPKFTRIGPHTLRYRRSDCRKYLKSRTFASTAEYAA